MTLRSVSGVERHESVPVRSGGRLTELHGRWPWGYRYGYFISIAQMIQALICRVAASASERVVIRPLAGARGYQKVQSSKDVGITLRFVIASPRNEGLTIQLDGLLRRCAPAHEPTLFVMAKEPERLRQSTAHAPMDCPSRPAAFAMTSLRGSLPPPRKLRLL